MRTFNSLLRFFFRHLYHDLAGFYDAVAWAVSLGAWADWVRTAVEVVEGERVLELGPGSGHAQAALLEAGLFPMGLDESEQMLRQSRRRIRQQGGTAGLTRGIAQELPFASNSLDSVLSTFPAEYILDPRTISEVWRVLCPGGLFVILPWAIRVEIRWYIKVAHQDRAMRATDLAGLLKSQGFETESRLVRRPNGTVALILARKAASL